MNLYVMFLLIIWRNQKMNQIYKYEHEKYSKLFSINKLKFNLENRI